MTWSKILFYSYISFIIGIFLSSLLQINQQFLIFLLFLGIFLTAFFFRQRIVVAIGLCLIFLFLGIWRYQAIELKISQNDLRKFNDAKEKIVLTGVVSQDPDIRENSIKLFVIVEEIDKKAVKGNVLITTARYPEYNYGDKLKIIGKLQTPPVFNDFNYQNYLKKDGIYSVMSFPEVELIDSGFGNPITASLFSFKNKFKEVSRSFISPPQEGLLEALFFGDESNISKEWKDKLNVTGTRHIAAVSGMNITILSFIILSFFLSLGFWRKHAFAVTALLLVFYILMIGAPASGVRAAIMASILMAAQFFGRLNSGVRAIVFAAVLMLFFNPLLLILDVGFQLSFLAILGLSYFQPTFFEWLKKIPNPVLFPIRTTLSATLAAQVFTLPIIVYNFGYMPLLSPIANILIVPVLAPVTILIFIFGVSAIIFPFFGLILSFPLWFSLSYIVFIVDFFSKISFVSLAIQNIHWIWLVISYFILGIIILKIYKKTGIISAKL